MRASTKQAANIDMAASASEAGRSDLPMMTIIQGGVKGASFGLDRPLPLLGGEGMLVDDVGAGAVADWLPDMSTVMGQANRRQSGGRAEWFHLPATALCGGTSEEACFIARRVARLSGLPLLVMDAHRLQPEALGRSGPSGSELVLPPDPVIAMAAWGCANPLVLMLGIETAAPVVADGLAAMLDVETSRRWLCQSMGAVLDLGAITWMVATSHEHSLPTSLYARLHPLSIDVPRDPAMRMLRVIGMAEEVMAECDLDIEEVGDLLATIFGDPGGQWEILSNSPASVLHQELTRMLLRAAHARRF